MEENTKGVKCPHCEKILDSVISSTGVRSAPVKDDFAVCGKCYSINIFDEKDNKILIRSTTDSELSLFMLMDPSLYSKLMYMRRDGV